MKILNNNFIEVIIYYCLVKHLTAVAGSHFVFFDISMGAAVASTYALILAGGKAAGSWYLTFVSIVVLKIVGHVHFNLLVFIVQLCIVLVLITSYYTVSFTYV